MQSRYGGKASRAEREADYTVGDKEAARFYAKQARADGFFATVRVVKTHRGRPRAWGVFLEDKGGQS